MRNIMITGLIVLFTACSAKETSRSFDLQGHRGARGLLPENTIPGFIKAAELGVNTLELDLVVTRDGELLVSHEPWFNHQISTRPDGNPVTEQEQMDLNIYEMTYDEIQKYDTGLRGNPDFPTQQSMETTKPLLREAITAVEEYIKEQQSEPVWYNIEIKSNPEWYGERVPPPAEFSQLLHNELRELDITDRINIQSFDPAPLVEFRKLAPDIPQAFLVMNEDSMEENLDRLGYTPEIYSPYYKLVTPELLAEAHEKNMKVIPWTINTVAEMRALLDMGVDGIITDYPDSAAVLR